MSEDGSVEKAVGTTFAVVVGGAAILGLVALIGTAVQQTSSSQSSTLSMAAPANASLSFTVSEDAAGWTITNDTDYLLNVCWAERDGLRASVPTMAPRRAVVLRPESFAAARGPQADGEWRITCNADAANIVGTVKSR